MSTLISPSMDIPYSTLSLFLSPSFSIQKLDMDSFKSLALAILIGLFVWSSSFETLCSGREMKGRDAPDSEFFWNKKESKSGGNDIHERRTPKSMYNNYQTDESVTKTATFNVLNFGAKGDGHTDDTKAFEAAWEAACKVEASIMEVPNGVFLVRPISFGPDCQPNIVFQLDGKIIAPTSSSAWGSGLLQWLEFKNLKGITVKGKGIIDGQGSVQDDSAQYHPTDDSMSYEDAKMSSTKPTALRFYGSEGVTVTGITIQNSPQTHLKFDTCKNVQVSSFTTSSPGDSPNTDGIHVQNSQDVLIYSSNFACGDDCISIQTGCSNVYIHDVNCGPGHGISIGGLGKDGTKACVSNVTVRNVIMQNTLTGVRIKTWQGGSGSVHQVMFSNIQVSDVKTPIMIDQYYCDGSKCQNGSSAVSVSDINYVNIRGTYTQKPVHFACSDNLPCTGISLTTIALKPSAEYQQPFCWEAYGELKTSTEPPISCLKSGTPSKPYAPYNIDSC